MNSNALDLSGDLVSLFRAVCDIASVSGQEKALADRVAQALEAQGHLEVVRDGDAVVARTQLGRERRVVIAGHLDTVPLATPANLPTRLVGVGEDAELWGRGTVDMKGGITMMLALAAELVSPRHDLTWVFYDHEEVAADLNGLGRLAATRPDVLTADFAILGEPTAAGVEGGCNGTMRAEVRVPGVAAHSARAWAGVNAVHAAGDVLVQLAAYRPAEVEVDGLVFREGLNAVGIRGGVAGNVIPDECVITVNYRFAPDKDIATAEAHLRDVLAGYDLTVTDCAPGARPGLDNPLITEFIDSVGAVCGGRPTAKLGWTDVARFAALGIPAVNFGPGDPLLAHAAHEHCPIRELVKCTDALRAWLVQ